MESGNWLFYAVSSLAIAVVLLTSLIKNVGWSHKAKNTVATVLSVAGAGVFILISPDRSLNDVGDFLALATSAYGSAQLLYHFILRGTSVEQKLASLNVVGPGTTEDVSEDGPSEEELFPDGKGGIPFKQGYPR